MPTIELVDTFADGSLEMSADGSEFRVAQSLQDAIASPAAAAAPLVVVPFVGGPRTITPGNLYFAMSGSTPATISVLTLATGLVHADIHGQRLGFHAIGGSVQSGGGTFVASGDGERIQDPRNLGGPLVTQVTLPYVGYAEWAFDKSGNAGFGLWRVAVWLDGAAGVARGLLETSGAALAVGAIPASGVVRRVAGGPFSLVGGPLLVDDAGAVTGAASVNGIVPFPLTGTAPADAQVQTAAPGVATDAARRDHKHNVLTAAPAALAIGSAQALGGLTTLARSDHVHAMPAAAAAVALAPGSANAPGVAATLARSDHTHQLPAFGSPAAEAVGSAAADGGLTTFARADHVHAMPGVATQSVSGFMPATDKTKLDNIAANAAALSAPAQTPTPISVVTADAGVGTVAARWDHVHTPATAAAVALVPGGSNGPGVLTTLARSDHLHALPAFGSPAAEAVGSAAADGGLTTFARADHVHAMPGLAGAADGFMPATAVTKLAGIATGADVTLTALSVAATNIAVNNKNITSLANPVNAQDAANKAYVDATAQGLDVKQSCRVIALTNIALTGTQTIDGVAVIVGDRVLCAGQTTASANGIYVVAAGAWARAADADISAEVTSGMFVFVVEGTANADSGWVLTTLDPIVLGTTSLAFAQFSGAGQIQAGTGLTKAGNTLNVVANADGSIVVAADDVKVGVLANDTQHGTRGGGTLHALAGAGVNGFMLGTDKAKLDNIAPAAAAVSNTAPADVQVQTASAGAATDAARRDHVHNVLVATPVGLGIGGANLPGTSALLARSDHVHATAAGGTPVALVPGGANATGAAVTVARSDHVHALPAFGSAAGTFCEGNDPRLSSSSAGFLTDDVPHWNGTIFVPLQHSVRYSGGFGPSNSTTHVNIPGLSIAVNRVGIFMFEFYIMWNTNNVNEGVAAQAAFTGSAGPVRYGVEIYTSNNAREVHCDGAFSEGKGLTTVGPGNGGEPQIIRISGGFSANSLGTLTAQMRCETGGANVFTAFPGSWGQLQQVS